MKTSKLQQGFSFTVWLCFAIVLIIVLLAPMNQVSQGYIVRAHVVEGFALAASAQTSVVKNAASGIAFNTGWIAPNATAYVSTKAVPTETDRKTNVYSGIAINPANGIITITYTNKIAMTHILFRRSIFQWEVLLNADYTLTITDKNKVARMMSDTPTLLLLPITTDKTLPVLGKPIQGNITWECHSATAPANDIYSNVLGTLHSKYVPANCRF